MEADRARNDFDVLDDGEELFHLMAEFADAIANWKDAGRWSAGLVRRATSIAVLLRLMIEQRSASFAKREFRPDRRFQRQIAQENLVHPPSKWAAA